MFIHPTATTGNAWYRSTRIGSYVDRDGMAAITCNLLGGDGIYVADGAYTYSPDDIDENGDFVGGSAIPETIYNQNEIEDDPYWNSKNWLGTGGVFNSTSFIATKGSTASTALKPRINYNGTGAYSEGFEERGNTSPLGLEIADMDLTGTGFSGTESTFKPALYAKLYDKLATLYRGGYVSKIKDKDNSGTTPETTIPETTTAKDSATKTTEPKNTENKKVATTTVTVNKTLVKKATKVKASAKTKIYVKKVVGAAKYQVQVSATKNFKKVLATKTSTKATFTIKNSKLKNKKVLYVRVKVAKKVNNKLVYSKWSASKKVGINKK